MTQAEQYQAARIEAALMAQMKFCDPLIRILDKDNREIFMNGKRIEIVEILAAADAVPNPSALSGDAAALIQARQSVGCAATREDAGVASLESVTDEDNVSKDVTSPDLFAEAIAKIIEGLHRTTVMYDASYILAEAVEKRDEAIRQSEHAKVKELVEAAKKYLLHDEPELYYQPIENFCTPNSDMMKLYVAINKFSGEGV